MASITLTLTGNSSQLQAQYFPSIDLSDGNYVCGLIDFQTFNSIPNVDETNNLFYFGHENLKISQKENNTESNEITQDFISLDPQQQFNENENDKKLHYSVDAEKPKNSRKKRATGNNTVRTKQPLTCIKIPTGSYEVSDLSKYLKKYLLNRKVLLELEANKNTLQCEIMCSQPIDFSKPNTIGPILGFRNNDQLSKNQLHVSPLPADILKINVIRVECDVITNSYHNSKPSHTIHEFSPKVPPGYKIIEVPQNVIYFPVTVKSIHALNLTVIDQNNQLINFRGETITVRLHIKKIELERN